MTEPHRTNFRWLRNGNEAFAAMLEAIRAARHSVRLEFYIFSAGSPGDDFRQELIHACERGVRVFAIVDAWGSQELSDEYWDPLRQAGAEFRWFNASRLKGLSFRDHRKLLVCDGQISFVGGFNLAPEYVGDGLTRGWCDVGLRIDGSLSMELAESFDKMFLRAELRHLSFLRLMKTGAHQRVPHADGDLLMSGPGRGFSTLKRSLRADLRNAHCVQIMAAYFLPTWQLRHSLMAVARRGGKVQIILPGKSDVPLSMHASRRLYHSMLRAGVEIYEYQPQVLHAKLLLLDNVTYVGSANLDTRSLHINYELSVRVRHPAVTEEARQLFEDFLAHSKRIDAKAWRASRTFWSRLKERWAHFILARLDLAIARRQLESLR